MADNVCMFGGGGGGGEVCDYYMYAYVVWHSLLCMYVYMLGLYVLLVKKSSLLGGRFG